jgi:hypothetical protein
MTADITGISGKDQSVLLRMLFLPSAPTEK